MKRGIFIALTLLSACNRADPAKKARRDAHDVAMVEAAQHVLPPPVPLVPQEVPAATLAQLRCRFTDPAHAAGRPILAAGPDRAAMRVGGQVMTLAADPGAGTIGTHASSHYTGKQFSLRFEPQGTPANPVPTALATGGAPQAVAMKVTDEHDRKVFEAVGDFSCAA